MQTARRPPRHIRAARRNADFRSTAPRGRFFEARFPDLGIITQGDSLEDAAFVAQDLLQNHIVLALREGRELPAPAFGHPCGEGEYRAGVVVDCDADTPGDDSMSVAEAAEILDVSESRVRAMIRDGILRSRKMGRVHRIDAESVMRRFNEPVPAGRPKGVGAGSRLLPAAQPLAHGEPPCPPPEFRGPAHAALRHGRP